MARSQQAQLLQNFRKIQLFLTPNDKLIKSTLSNGVSVYGKNARGYGGRGVFLYRDSIEPELEIITELLDADDVFFDVGANTGVYSLLVADHLREKGVVVAFEPVPELIVAMEYSIAKNSLSNIRLRNLCLGAETGVRTLWLNDEKPNSFSISNRIGEPKGTSVLTAALDDLFDWEGLDRLNYLKIDAEGAEAEILKGGMSVLSRYRPIVQLETTKEDVLIPLADYVEFRLPQSPNKICIPREHNKLNSLEKFMEAF